MDNQLLPAKRQDNSENAQQALTLSGRHQLDEMLELFLKARDLAVLSRQLYRRAVKRFILWLSDRSFHPATVGVAYRDYLGLAYPDKPRTVATYLSPVRGFFKFLVAQGQVRMNPFDGIRARVDSSIYERPVLSEVQVVNLLASLRAETLTEIRDRALIFLLLHTGLRIAEAMSLNTEDIEERDGVTVLMVLGKGRVNRDEYVVLMPDVLEVLESYLQRTGRQPTDVGALFLAHNRGDNGGGLTKIGAQKAVARRLQEAGLKKPGLAAHSLRHTAATCALRHGATPFEVSKMLRHKSLSSTMIYLHDQERLTAGAEYRVRYDKPDS